MNLNRIQDFTNKNWYVDYKDEDGYATYGPDTHEGCTKWIQSMNARVASGEKFDVDKGPYQKEAEKVKDSTSGKASPSDLADALNDIIAMGVESGSMNLLINGDQCEAHFEYDDFVSISLIAPEFSAGASSEDWPEDKEWDPEALLDQGVANIVDAVKEHYGDEFSFEILSDEDEIYDSKIKDGHQEEYAAESAIDADKVMDLYEQGQITVKVPENVDIHEFAQACISFIDELWGEPEVNFQYEDAEFNYNINEDEGNIVIYTVD